MGRAGRCGGCNCSVAEAPAVRHVRGRSSSSRSVEFDLSTNLCWVWSSSRGNTELGVEELVHVNGVAIVGR